MKRYAAFLRQQLHSTVFYRFDFFINVLYGLIAMYGARCLWSALYLQSPALLERDLPSMITYAMLAMALDIIFYPSGDRTPYKYMNAQVKSGAIDTDLLRPMDFQRQMLYRNSSYMVITLLLLVLPACIVALLTMGMQLPATPVNALLFALSLALGYLVLFSLNFMVGLLSMVTLNIRQIAWAYNGLVSLFSGKLVPIWLFPAPLRAVTQLLPFRCVFDIPLNIYTGAVPLDQAALELGLQFVWAAALMGLGQLLWRRVSRRITVQGG